MDQLLTWRNEPQVTQWLLSTMVDPESYRRAWLNDVDDPLDHSGVALRDGVVIGTATLHVKDSMGQGTKQSNSPWAASEAGIGYVLDPRWHGQGFGTEIVGALLSLAFDALGLHRVTAGCFADNIGSWRVMEKWGMRREQHGVRDSWHAEHGWIDGYTYALLRSEWQGSEGQRVSAGWGGATSDVGMGQAG